MTASELEARLKKLRQKYGDLPVRVYMTDNKNQVGTISVRNEQGEFFQKNKHETAVMFLLE